MSTLADYRQATAKLFGQLFLSTATAGSTASVLEDSRWPVKSTADISDLYVDQYIYRPAAALATDRTRAVKNYLPSSGVLIPDLGWTNAPSAGEAYELHPVIEPAALHDCINEALRDLPHVVELTLTPTSNLIVRHSLATLTEITEPWQVRSVGILPAWSSREEYTPVPTRGDVERDGDALYLRCGGLNTTDLLYLTVVVPAYGRCATSAGVRQDGLALETDTCPLPVEWVKFAAAARAWERFGHLLAQNDSPRLVSDYRQALALFEDATRRHFTLPPQGLSVVRQWGGGR